jgi:hypothetical protein
VRYCQSSAADPDLRLSQQVLAWLRGRGVDLFYVPELYHRGPSAVRDKATAMKIVGVLADHGHIEAVSGGAEIDGKWRRDVFRLAPEE